MSEGALTVVPVRLGERSYDVVIGPGARHRLPDYLPKGSRRAVVVTQASIPVSIHSGLEESVTHVSKGEEAKSLATLESLLRRFARASLSRRDVVISLGGGVVNDVAGFAASVWHRGTSVVHVATTLLAQIDAAIGGKTAVNLPEGKNLVGSFWQPHAVICDTETLSSLPDAEWRSGYGEMAKYALLGVEGLVELPLEKQIEACVRLKAAAVADDERESGRRALLNYGHTLAHALEAAGLASSSGGEELPLRHGEAVAIGLLFAARLAYGLGRIDARRLEQHDAVVARYSLPTSLPEGTDRELLVQLMRRDKKAHGDLTFVLDGRDGLEVVSGVEADVVRAVLEEMQT